MEKVIGPTISVSTSGYYLSGNSSDATSGVAKYCYNTSDTPGSYTNVPAITVGAYSVPQYHVTATGTYRCHVLDTAGNYGVGLSDYITYYTYHCNYCNQNTNSIHYNCPTHYTSQSCLTTSKSCSFGADSCYGFFRGTYETSPLTSNFTCDRCGESYTNQVCFRGKATCDSCGVSKTVTWCQKHGQNFTKQISHHKPGCGNLYTTNYTTN